MSLEEKENLLSELAAEQNVKLESCPGPWLYDPQTRVYRNSLIEAFNLVCKRRVLIPHINAWLSVGLCLACFVGGPLADRFGRKRLYCTCYPISGLIMILIKFVSSFWLFIVMRTVAVFFHGIAYIAGYIMLLEMTNYKHRNTFVVLDGIAFYLVGGCLLILLNYLIQDNFWVHFVIGCILQIALLVVCILPESPVWLLAKGRYEEAALVIRRAILMNGGSKCDAAEITAQRLATSCLKPEQKPTSQVSNWTVFFTHRKSRRIWLPLVFPWMTIAGVFYGISYYNVRLPGNPYVIAVLMCLISVPSKLIQWFLYDCFDRKKPLIYSLAISGILCLIGSIGVWFNLSSYLAITMGTLTNGIMTAAFDMAYLWSPELFPTLCRSTALGVLVSVSRIGMFGGMFVERLDELVWKPMPLLVMAVSLILSGILIVFVPQNNSRHLVESFDERGPEPEEENQPMTKV